MNYYNRLTSLLLGEASYIKENMPSHYPKEGSGPDRPNASIPPDPRLKSPDPKKRKAAERRRAGEREQNYAGFLGRVSMNKGHARGIKNYTPYQPGVNPAEPVAELPDLKTFKRGMAAPKAWTARASLKQGGRRG